MLIIFHDLNLIDVSDCKDYEYIGYDSYISINDINYLNYLIDQIERYFPLYVSAGKTELNFYIDSDRV
jgi:hypothetical protein